MHPLQLVLRLKQEPEDSPIPQKQTSKTMTLKNLQATTMDMKRENSPRLPIRILFKLTLKMTDSCSWAVL